MVRGLFDHQMSNTVFLSLRNYYISHGSIEWEQAVFAMSQKYTVVSFNGLTTFGLLFDYLVMVADWMRNNHNEVLFIIDEALAPVTLAGMQSIYDLAFANVTQRYDISAAILGGTQPWPTYQSLLNTNQRLIVLTTIQSQIGTGTGFNPLYSSGSDMTTPATVQQTPYVMHTASDFQASAFSSLPALQPGQLLLFNHFFYTDMRAIVTLLLAQLLSPSDLAGVMAVLPASLDMADPTKLALSADIAVLGAHAQMAISATGRRPNFFMMDFILPNAPVYALVAAWNGGILSPTPTIVPRPSVARAQEKVLSKMRLMLTVMVIGAVVSC